MPLFMKALLTLISGTFIVRAVYRTMVAPVIHSAQAIRSQTRENVGYTNVVGLLCSKLKCPVHAQA